MVIDLDAVSPVAPAVSGRPRLTTLAVALVVLAVGTLGGSAAPAPGLRPVLSVANTSGVFTLAPAGLYTTDFGRAPGRQATVWRHALDDPSSRWSAEVSQTVGSLDVVGPARVLVVGPAQVLMTTSVDALRTTFLDSVTGETLWSTTNGSVLRLADTGALMTGETAGAGVVRLADLRTGRTLWSRELGSGGHLDPGDPPTGPGSRIVTVDDRGRAAVLSFADGSVQATAELGAVNAAYAAVGSQLYAGGRELTAYRLPDLREMWRSDTVPLSRPAACGPAQLCVPTAAGLTVLDTGTGRTLWSDGRWSSGVDTRALGLPGPPRIAAADNRPDPGRALLDPATGVTLSMLGPGTFAGGTLLRPDRTEPGRTWVQITGRHHGVRTVGALDAVVPSRCTATADHLACPTYSGRLGVWRLPA